MDAHRYNSRRARAGAWARVRDAGTSASAGTRAQARAWAQARVRAQARTRGASTGAGAGVGAGTGAGTGAGADAGRRRGARAQGAKCGRGHGRGAQAWVRGAGRGRGGAGCGHGAAGTGCGRWAQAGIRCAKSKGNLRRIAYRRAHNGFRAQGRVKYGGTATLGTTGAVAVQHRLRRNRRTAAGIGCRSFDVIAICSSLLWDNPRRARTHTNFTLFHAGAFESIAWRRRPPRPASPRLR